MPTTIAQIDIINQALALLGVKPLTDLEALDDIPAEQARIAWPQCLATVGRSHGWNCLLKAQQLQPEAQDPINPPAPVPASTPWAPATNYAAGDYVTFGNPAYLYQALIANLSSASFVNDLTSGYWFQTDTFNSAPFASCAGSNYASGWAYKYALPEDLLLLVKLNDTPCAGAEEEFEIMGSDLYTDEACAVIKYTWAQPDTTRYDALFVEALTFKLASKLATMLRQDDENIMQAMEGLYLKKLSAARAKDAGERKPRRFDPTQNSRFLNSRYFSTNS